MNIRFQNHKGFTIVELLVVIGIIAALFALATVNLVRTQHTASVSAAVDQLIADMRVQQTRAMSGTVDISGNANSYGVYFPPGATGSYVLFRGTAYSSSDNPSNLTVSPTAITFSTNLPSNTLVFAQRSGEFSGYVTGPYTITVTNSYGTEQKTITVNRYGMITQVTTP